MSEDSDGSCSEGDLRCRIAPLFGERIYEHIGAERDAFSVTDPLGKATAGGSMCVTAHDMLRLA